MSEFAQIEPVQSDKIFQIGRFHLAGVGQAWRTWDDIRDAVIDEVTIHGKAQQPTVIVRLIRGFLQRLPLPRLLHFLDLVLPQMVPVCFSAQTTGFQFAGSQLIRDPWLQRDEGVFVQEPEVTKEVTLGRRSLTMHLWTQNVARRKEWLLWCVRSSNQVDTVRLESILLFFFTA